jgi:hypothetical protein
MRGLAFTTSVATAVVACGEFAASIPDAPDAAVGGDAAVDMRGDDVEVVDCRTRAFGPIEALMPTTHVSAFRVVDRAAHAVVSTNASRLLRVPLVDGAPQEDLAVDLFAQGTGQTGTHPFVFAGGTAVVFQHAIDATGTRLHQAVRADVELPFSEAKPLDLVARRATKSRTWSAIASSTSHAIKKGRGIRRTSSSRTGKAVRSSCAAPSSA